MAAVGDANKLSVIKAAENGVEDIAAYRAIILETFSRYDQNRDGIISRDEMCALLRVLDSSGCIECESVDELLEALDRNGDGLVDTEEFVDWALNCSVSGPAFVSGVEASLANLAASHVFLQPQDEANLERCTLWQLHREENNKILTDLKIGPIDDPELLVMSVGSSSTQVYDALEYAVAFPVGTKVSSPDVYKELTASLNGKKYSRVVLLNSIGYQLSVADPCLVTLSELARRAEAKEKGALPTTVDLHAALLAALPDATMYVYNRAKDPATKRYKYCQLVNDFTEALVSGNGLKLLSRAGAATEKVQNAVVDWGGSSFKVYVSGKRIGTELMDANKLLCPGGTLSRTALVEAVREIKLFVLRLLPEAGHIFIAQTGKTRELALKEGLFSADEVISSAA